MQSSPPAPTKIVDKRVSPRPEIDAAIDVLSRHKAGFAALPLHNQIDLTKSLIDHTAGVYEEWVQRSCDAKGISSGSPLAGEEIANGPLATMRFLRLIRLTLIYRSLFGSPQLPGKLWVDTMGRLCAPVFPSAGLFDRLLFRGLSAHVHFLPQTTAEQVQDRLRSLGKRPQPGVALVLGAGNVSSIAITDVLSKLFQQGQVALLKMNPVNDYLGPIFEQALRPLIERGYVRLIYGGAEVGSYAASHPQVDSVHITGSHYSHEAIVWGATPQERERRKAENSPLLAKPITSELGNVTPWVVVPGPYTERELKFQAENLAAAIVNNASFNCIAAKLVVTWRDWPQREQFLNLVDQVLQATPARLAYYPGAADRFSRFAPPNASQSVPPHENGRPQTLPWTLVRDVDPDRDPHYFQDESFVCVTAETARDANSPEDFLDAIPDFVNDCVWGALGITLVVHPSFRRRAGNEARLRRAIDRLRYGTVAINHWAALSYAIMSTPWGGYPGGTLANPQSGIGWVHNAYQLDGIEKTVLEGPLTLWPKPFWFPTHRSANSLAWKVAHLYHRPSAWRLPGIFRAALQG